MHLELCRGYKKDPLPTYVAEVAQSWRVAGDNWDWWPHTIETIVRCCMHNSPSLSLSLASHNMLLSRTVSCSPQNDFVNESRLAGPYGWNYGDFLMTGGAGCDEFESKGEHCPGQNDAEYRTQFAVYALCASPLIIGTDVRDFTPIMSSILLNEEMLAVNQDYTAPAGDLVGRFNKDGSPCVVDKSKGRDCKDAPLLLWARYMSDKSIVVGVTNIDDDDVLTLTIDFASLFAAQGWGKTTIVQARDLYAKADGPTVTGAAMIKAGIHDTTVWKLTPQQ